VASPAVLWFRGDILTGLRGGKSSREYLDSFVDAQVPSRSLDFARDDRVELVISGAARYTWAAGRVRAPVPTWTTGGWWPTQALFWFEWGSRTSAQSFPSGRSRFRAVHSDLCGVQRTSAKFAEKSKINARGVA
jgi:hypothetical protein